MRYTYSELKDAQENPKEWGLPIEAKGQSIYEIWLALTHNKGNGCGET